MTEAGKRDRFMEFQQPQPTRYDVTVFECQLSRRRCAELALADFRKDSYNSTYPNAEKLLAGPTPDLEVRIEFRAVVYNPESAIDLYFRTVDQVGDSYWASMDNGLDIGSDTSKVMLYRRVIIAELFRRALASSRLASTTPGRPRVIDLGDLTPS